MQDDDKQPSYERLDETNPERNRRSFFDWLRGKEETDEEKLRKKLDEELKEAARKHATEFEEERRIEEQREVAETRKLKKRWRAKLVEKSKQLLEEAAERGNEPTDGYEIARLMVAERIVKLHEMLTTEDLRKSEMKSLKIHIDFMGLLSEKLDKPELEVPEEVEELYQTIAQSVEETTGETQGTTTETPPDKPETTPVSEEDAAYTAFAASIVKAIRRALHPETTPRGDTSGDGGSSTSTPEPAPKPAPTPTPERTPTSSVERTPVVERPRPSQTSTAPRAERPAPAAATERLLTTVKNTALSSEAIRKEISHTEDARNLAEVVQKAAIIDRYVTQEAKRPAPAPLPENPVPIETKRFNLPPNKKIKFLTENELLKLAKTVEVGGGRLLSDLYKKGEIDREGLVKVLESVKKGRDYRRELVSRREKWRRHKLSQEYVPQTPVPIATPDNQPATPTAVSPSSHARNLAHRLASLALSPAAAKKPKNSSETQPTETSKNFKSPAEMARNLKERLKRENQVAVLFVSVLLVVIIFIVVLELNTP